VSACRIAIADDHAVVRSGYRRLLELDGEFVVVAEFDDGESAYRWLCGNDADLLILDLSMPGCGGLATLQRLHSRRPDLRVMVFTMHASAALAERALRLGAAGYVTKSSPPETLIAAIREIRRGGCALSRDVGGRDAPACPAALPHESLSAREFDIFLLLAGGASIEQIAASRCLSAKTVANYQTTIRHKTGLGNALQMHCYAQRHGLLQPVPSLVAAAVA
jgi:DNA-binding NarL/FixJ family response regulator